jgi:ATP/maltotriose-dependent transcriptional regulator MalT/DNA-binding MarR family transcriptional regulator
MPQKPSLTIKEKILLHLLENSKYEGKFEVPYSLTQDGISEVVGVRRSYVSQTAKELSEKGLLADQLSHVKGEGRRRKAYFLTPSGKSEAKRLCQNIRDCEVILRNNEEERTLKISELRREYRNKLSVIEVIEGISEEGVFDANIKRPSKPSAKIDSPLVYPKPRYFFGRERELEIINDFLGSESFRILTVKGIAGIGKTTLMAKVVDSKKDKQNVFWYKFHSWSTTRNLLSHLFEFLILYQKDGLKHYIEEVRVIDIGDVCALLRTQLEDVNALFIFDDFHMASQKILDLFSALTEILKELKGVKMVVIGRRIPKFFDRRDVLVDNLIFELPLRGLDKESSQKLLEQRNIDSEHLDDLYESTKGHPLSLELVELSQGRMGKGNIKQFLWEEVLVRLSEEEKDLLRFASVFRYPIQSEAYLTIPQRDDKRIITHEVIDNLVEKSLISSQNSLYNVHDIIRAFFYQRLVPDVKKEYHRKVAEYFEDEADDLALIEAQYHHIKAGNQNRTVGLAVQYGEHLINTGYLEEFKDILNSILKESVAPQELITLLCMEGDILTTLGQWDRAYALYEKCLEVASKLEDLKGMAQAYYRIAAIYYRRGDLDRALILNNKSYKLLKDEDEPFELAKLYNNIGFIHWKKGSLKKAEENYIQSHDIAEELGDLRGIARAQNNLGIIHWEKGELDLAIDYYQKSLDIASELCDRQTQAILYDNLGEVYLKKGDIDSAKTYFEDSLELSRKLGFRWQIAEVLRNLGNVYDGEEAKRYLTQAYEMFLKLGAKKDAMELEVKLNGN